MNAQRRITSPADLHRSIGEDLRQQLSPLMRDVEAFLLASRMEPKAFGRQVAQEPRLIETMRAGRTVGPRIEAQIKLFISMQGFKAPRPEIAHPSPSTILQRDEMLNGFLQAEARRIGVPLIDLLVEMTRKGAEVHAAERGIEF